MAYLILTFCSEIGHGRVVLVPDSSLCIQFVCRIFQQCSSCELWVLLHEHAHLGTHRHLPPFSSIFSPTVPQTPVCLHRITILCFNFLGGYLNQRLNMYPPPPFNWNAQSGSYLGRNPTSCFSFKKNTHKQKALLTHWKPEGREK